MSDMINVGSFTLLPEAQAIIAMDPTRDMFVEPTTWVNCDGNKVAPWGDDNDLPAQVMEKINKSEVVASNLHFLTQLTYGQGIKPMMKVGEGQDAKLEECTDPAVLNFFDDNDIPGYFLEQCSDMNAFFNVFPEIILTKDLTKIISLRHKEATFSRWGIADADTGEIFRHYYSGRWNLGTQSSNYVATDVLSRYNPLLDLNTRIENRKIKSGEARFIIPVNFPTPGRIYYQQPPFWSIFQSGSYDYAVMLWEFKKLLLKQGLSIRYIIYISDKYWDIIFQEEKIDRNNPESVKARKEAEFTKFRDFLGSSANAGKGILALKKMVLSGTSAIEEKYITIEEIKSNVKGGEFLDDSSEVNSTISYAMSVYTQLIGSTPGKTGGSLSGTDKREMYMIKSALMKPYRDRLMRPLQLIKRFNQWPENLVFTVPDYEFTTLADSKTGKQLNTPEDVNQ